MKNVTLDGNGSDFIFHGQMIAAFIGEIITMCIEKFQHRF